VVLSIQPDILLTPSYTLHLIFVFLYSPHLLGSMAQPSDQTFFQFKDVDSFTRKRSIHVCVLLQICMCDNCCERIRVIYENGKMYPSMSLILIFSRLIQFIVLRVGSES